MSLTNCAFKVGPAMINSIFEAFYDQLAMFVDSHINFQSPSIDCGFANKAPILVIQSKVKGRKTVFHISLKLVSQHAKTLVYN